MLTRSDRRSLAYHRAVLGKLRSDPERSLARANAHLDKLAALHPHASRLLDRWREWLALPLEELARRALDPGEVGCDMRQVSPFAGQLSAAERAAVIRGFRMTEDKDESHAV